MTSWIKEIKHLASQESARRASIAEKGRSCSDGPDRVLSHIDACYELMEYFNEFDSTTQKQNANRYNIHPTGMEGIVLVKDGGSFVPTSARFEG